MFLFPPQECGPLRLWRCQWERFPTSKRWTAAQSCCPAHISAALAFKTSTLTGSSMTTVPCKRYISQCLRYQRKFFVCFLVTDSWLMCLGLWISDPYRRGGTKGEHIQRSGGVCGEEPREQHLHLVVEHHLWRWRSVHLLWSKSKGEGQEPQRHLQPNCGGWVWAFPLMVLYFLYLFLLNTFLHSFQFCLSEYIIHLSIQTCIISLFIKELKKIPLDS